MPMTEDKIQNPEAEAQEQIRADVGMHDKNCSTLPPPF